MRCLCDSSEKSVHQMLEPGCRDLLTLGDVCADDGRCPGSSQRCKLGLSSGSLLASQLVPHQTGNIISPWVCMTFALIRVYQTDLWDWRLKILKSLQNDSRGVQAVPAIIIILLAFMSYHILDIDNSSWQINLNWSSTHSGALNPITVLMGLLINHGRAQCHKAMFVFSCLVGQVSQKSTSFLQIVLIICGYQIKTQIKVNHHVESWFKWITNLSPVSRGIQNARLSCSLWTLSSLAAIVTQESDGRVDVVKRSRESQ